jgi:hypothetical protein
MTKQEIEIAKKHLAIFERQKQKYEMYIEETKALVEELTTQVELYPDDEVLKDYLKNEEVNLQNFEKQHNLLLLKIEAIETSI